MTLFDRIKKVSKEHGYSIAEVERKAGISPNYLYQWKKRSPSPESLSDVAKVLNVSVDYLLGNDDTQKNVVHKLIQRVELSADTVSITWRF